MRVCQAASLAGKKERRARAAVKDAPFILGASSPGSLRDMNHRPCPAHGGALVGLLGMPGLLGMTPGLLKLRWRVVMAAACLMSVGAPFARAEQSIVFPISAGEQVAGSVKPGQHLNYVYTLPNTPARRSVGSGVTGTQNAPTARAAVVPRHLKGPALRVHLYTGAVPGSSRRAWMGVGDC